jgi:hypothetical protein
MMSKRCAWRAPRSPVPCSALETSLSGWVRDRARRDPGGGNRGRALRQRAPELARASTPNPPGVGGELAFTKACIPLDKPYGRLFAEDHDGAIHPDDIVAAWHRTMLDTEPPQDVLERLRSRDADERIARWREALQSEETEEDAD